MNRRVALLFLVVGCSVSRALAGGPALGVRALPKKLIEYGWDVPFPDFVRANIRAMEKRPFDGLIFKLRGGGKALAPTAWDEAKFAQDFENLRQIRWEKFTDNFVIMWAASKQDWFDDAHWRAIEHNVGLVAKAARIGRCVGVCWDPEPYGPNPWDYRRAAHAKTKSFAAYEAIARRRGAQFVRAIQRELPKAKILTLFQLSVLGHLLVPMKPEDRAAKLSRHHYGLLPAFLNGMLDGAGEGVAIIDGNEPAYYYTDSRQHLSVFHLITQRARLLIDSRLWPKYRAQVRVGQALYIDQYFGLRTRKVLGHHMTPAERPKWFEHNVYWALHTSDRYVWCYSERMNWWRDKGIPPGCEEAIRSARRKVAAGLPLGFDIQPIVEQVRQRERAEITRRLKRRTATIRRVPAGTPPPRIDGKLDDAAWKQTPPLSFAPLAAAPQKQKATTTARVTYDERALYVAFRCEEPNPKGMRLVGENHDDDIWQGDVVEVMVSEPGRTAPFTHFILNPRGVRWDARHVPATDLSANPAWRSAVQVGANFWAAELAIPWDAMKMAAPKPGSTLRANLCRQRIQGRELSAWSPMARGFLEHDLFGTWTFK